MRCKWLLLACFALLSFVCQSSFAAFQWRLVSTNGQGCGSTSGLPELTCELVKPVFSYAGKEPKDLTCNGIDAVVDNKGGSFTVSVPSPGSGNPTTSCAYGTTTLNATRSGDCKAGREAGEDYIPVNYQVWGSPTGEVLKQFRDPMSLVAAKSGCQIKAYYAGGYFCTPTAENSKVALCEQLVKFQETGAEAKSPQSPDKSVPGYGDGGSGGGGGTGVGDGGDGGTGGGDGGSGGGGGSGGDGGGSGGGGGDGGGSGGGDGGSGGDGGGNGGGGDQQQNCGAPGQPACKIDETGTPTGEGLFDELLKLVDGIGKEREKGLEDLKSDDGKDTSVPFGFQVPRVACTNPTVRVPGFAGSWEVDICQYVTLLSAMFEALWSALFVFAVMSLVARATSKPVA